jgi:hypothetical protein
MKYRYTSFFPPDSTLKWIKRPMVQIEVSGPQNTKKFNALIDSGADYCLFNTEVAELVGLDLSKAKTRRLTGIGSIIEGFYLNDVEMRLEGIEKTIKIPVCFVKTPNVGLLLGQEGFFDKFRIRFEKDHDTFEIIPIKK